jgi:Concanavalin A-like lectin/glucanases superfamily
MARRARITLLFSLFLLALTAPTALADYAGTVLADNPDTYWRLNDASGPTAVAAAGTSGTYDTVTSTAAPFASLGTAAELGTAGRITGNAAGGAATIELWVRPASNVKRDQVLAEVGDVRIGADRRKKLYIEKGGARATSRLTMGVGRWSLVDVRWNNGDGKVWFTVNAVTGTATKSVNAPGGLTTASGAITLGDGPAGNDHLNGRVDEFALYPIYLPDSKVQDHFKQTGAPLGMTPPTISGTPIVSGTLTANTGTWQNPTTGALSYAYQWALCDVNGCDDVKNGTSDTLSIDSTMVTVDELGVEHSASPVGKTAQVEVVAGNVNGTASQISEETAAIAAAPTPNSAPDNTTLPSIVGNPPFVGRALSSSDGVWGGSTPLALTRVWQRCDAGGGSCVDIDGATGSSYTPAAADIGSTLRLAVTGTNSVGTVVAHSAVTSVIPDPNTTTDPGPQDGSGGTGGTGTTTNPGTNPTGSTAACLRFTTLPKRLNKKIKRIGRVRIGPVKGSKAGTAAVKLQVRLLKGKKLKQVTWFLDGKKIKTAKKRPYTLSLRPAQTGKAGTHVLKARLTPKKGKSQTLKTFVLTRAC